MGEPLPPVANVCRVQTVMQINEDTNILNRMFFNFTGDMTDTIAEAIGGDVSTEWGDNLKGYIGTNGYLIGVNVQDLSSDTGANYDLVTSVQGTGGGLCEAAEIALVTKFPIQRRYRGGHPRWYQSGIVVGFRVDAQHWTSAFIADWSASFALFVGAISGYESGGVTIGDQVNVSYYKGFTNVLYPSGRYHVIPTLRETPVVDTVVGLQVNPIIGSQRRRSEQSR